MVELKGSNQPINEVYRGLSIEPLNPVSFVVSNQNYSRADFEFAPSKVQRRLMLTDSGWCRMGTMFIPPGDSLSLQDLNFLLQKMNKINNDSGRPNDSDLVIRTASKFGPLSNWSESAFLASDIDTEMPKIKNLADFKDADYQESMEAVKGSWKMLHTDNLPLQKNAIHGRIQVNGYDLKLDIGSNMSHARGLEKGEKTMVQIPLNEALSFFSLGSFKPNNLTIQGNDLSMDVVTDYLNRYAPAGAQLGSFIDWVSANKGLKKYVAEFRYYVNSCLHEERFHVMDLDINY